MRKRLLGILLTLCMVVSLMPTGAYGAKNTQGTKGVQTMAASTAENAEASRKTLQFGGDVIEHRDNVYIGQMYYLTDNYEVKWRVIDNKTNLGREGLFLLSDKVLGSVPYAPGYQGNNPVWQNSDAQKWCRIFAGETGLELSRGDAKQAFSELEQGTIIKTTETGSDENRMLLKDEKVFLLSSEEATGKNSKRYGFSTDNDRMVGHIHANYTGNQEWLLRDATKSINRNGKLGEWKVNEYPKIARGMRPAFNMNPDLAVMTSAAEGGKPGEADGTMTAVTTYAGGDWKLTLRDESRKGFKAWTGAKNIYPGATISVDYSGAKTGGNEYISAIIVDRNDNILYYGRLAKAESSSGSAQLIVPTSLTASGRYSIKIFNEQYNGDRKTDYIGDFIEVCAFNNAQSTQFGTGRITGYQFGYDYIYYGQQDGNPIKWRVLDNKANNGNEGFFLLSEKTLARSIPFNKKDDNKWQGSDARKWCQDFAAGDAFSDRERSEIIATSKSDKALGVGAGTILYPETTNILNGDKVFFLSAEEALSAKLGFVDAAARVASLGEKTAHWWLRSPYIMGRGAYVDYDGIIRDTKIAGAEYIDGYCYSGARPAFNLSKDNILFISEASGFKSNVSGGNLNSVNDYRGSEWKLTLKDESREGFTATASKTDNLTAGEEIRINYSGAKTGDNEYVAAMILDEAGKLLYYGHIANNLESLENTQLVIPSDLAKGKYTLRLFSEQDNGDYRTNYASNIVNIQIRINEKDTTAPTVSFAGAVRISAGTAEVEFQSSEAGYYYYALNGATIDTTGAGTRFNGLQEARIKIRNLDARKPYTVAIVVKDLAGNKSNEANGNIPADAKYKVTLNTNGGTIAEEKNVTGYNCGEVTYLPTEADVTREGYTFAGWYTDEELTDSARVISQSAYGDKTFYAKWIAKEQFNLTQGGTYYFDLASLGIPGKPNSGTKDGAASLPDTTLHYVPFTYAGVVEAYKLDAALGECTTDKYAKENKYPHSLFIAENNVTNCVSWNQLKDNGLVFGKNYSSNGVEYSMRTPSAGSAGELDSLKKAKPEINEWDSILDKSMEYIKNWNKTYSWGQDEYKFTDVPSDGSMNVASKVLRGFKYARSVDKGRYSIWGDYNDYVDTDYIGFRPVLEVLNASALGADGLKPVTLDLNGGKLGESTDNISIIVKNGADFTAPTVEGLIPPSGHNTTGFTWLGSDDKSYAPGETVPAEVTSLKAQWAEGDQTYTVTLHTNGGTIASGKNVTSYIYGTGANLPIAEEITKEDYTFEGWYTDENFTGEPVTEISENAYGNLSFYAKWTTNEQFSLAPGGTYYFDLSALDIPGTVNSSTNDGAASLPDTTLHYVPFTYVGAVNAYKLNPGASSYTTDKYAEENKYTHSLFIAEYNVTKSVSWDELNEKNMIFGKNYSQNGVEYSMRTPSVGSSKPQESAEAATPVSNEWDRILNKNKSYIKNWNGIESWGQDECQSSGILTVKVLRGDDTVHELSDLPPNLGEEYTYVGFRPVLEVLNAGTLGADGLKPVTLDLNGGTLGERTDNISIIVKNGADFTAPTVEGLITPSVYKASEFKWLGSDDKSYAPGADVPAEVTSLTAQWTRDIQTYTITASADPADDGFITGTGTFEENTSVTLTATANEGYNFVKWTENVTEVSTTASYTFTVTKDRNLVAVFEEQQPTPAPKYTVAISGGYAASNDGAGSYQAGETVTINAGTRSRYSFTGWTSDDGVIFDNASSAITTFTMPDHAVTITANWRYRGGGTTYPSKPGTDPSKPGGDKPNPGQTTDPSKPGTDPGKPGTDPGQPTEPTEDDAAKIGKVKAIIADLTLIARSSKTTNKNIKVTLREEAKTKAAIKKLEDLGFTVKYGFYRSTKKSAGYKSAITKKTATYTNTKGIKGTKYYYKIQLKVYDDKGKLIAKTALKQCRYGTRIWSK